MCSAGPVLGQRAQPGAVSAEGLASPPRPTPGPRALLRILLPLEPRAPRKPVRPPSPVNSHPAVLCGHSLALTHHITTCCFFLCLRASRRGAPRDGHWCVLHEPGGVLRARVSVQVNSCRDRSTGTAASVGWWRAPGPAGSSFCCAFSGTEPSGCPGRGAGPGSPSPPRPWCWLFPQEQSGVPSPGLEAQWLLPGRRAASVCACRVCVCALCACVSRVCAVCVHMCPVCVPCVRVPCVCLCRVCVCVCVRRVWGGMGGPAGSLKKCSLFLGSPSPSPGHPLPLRSLLFGGPWLLLWGSTSCLHPAPPKSPGTHRLTPRPFSHPPDLDQEPDPLPASGLLPPPPSTAP